MAGSIHYLLAGFYILQVVITLSLMRGEPERGLGALDVMESVVADTVTFYQHARIYVRVLLYIVTHYKKRSPDTVLLEYIQYGRCDFGYRSVVEGKIHYGLTIMQNTCFAAPCDTAVQVLHPRRELV